MAAKLTVKKEYLNSEVHYSNNGGSYKVELGNATQEQLRILKEMKNPATGEPEFDHLFESDKAGKKE